jgi:Outer membrane lipoprotein-sorting protein
MRCRREGLLIAVVVGAGLGSGGSGRALDRNSKDPRAILQAALDTQNPRRASSRMKMSIRDGAGTRERWMTVRSMRFEGGRKSLILIEQPADVRNTGFLSIDYSARGKADEQWLYLPKLHRVSRVPSSGKADGFVGSDFSISDLAGPDPDSFEAKIAEASVKVGDEECWSIDAWPRDDAARDAFGYSKVQLWVSKDKLLIVQLKATTADGKRTKYFKVSDLQKDGGVWTPHRLQMRTLEGTRLLSETVIDVLSVDNAGADVVEGDFTQQRLERGV